MPKQTKKIRAFKKRIGKVRALSPSARHEKLFGERPFSYVRYRRIFLKKNVTRFGMSPAERRFADIPQGAQSLILAHHSRARKAQKTQNRAASYLKKTILAAIRARKVYLSLEYFVRNFELFCHLTRYCEQNNLEFLKNTFRGNQCKLLMRGIESMVRKTEFINAAKSFLEKKISRLPANVMPKWQELFVELGLQTKRKPNISKVVTQKLGEIVTSKKTLRKLMTSIQERRPVGSIWLPHLIQRIEAEQRKHIMRLTIAQQE